MLKGGADPNKRSGSRKISLDLATKENKIEYMKLLIKYGAKLQFEDNPYYTPLDSVKSLEGAKLLFESGAKINKRTIQTLARQDYKEINEYADIIQFLVDHGADANAKDEYGNTALHHSKNPSVTEKLLKLGLDPNAINNKKNTPLHELAEDVVLGHKFNHSFRVEVAKVLCKYGADLTLKNSKKETPLEASGYVTYSTSVHTFPGVKDNQRFVDDTVWELYEYLETQVKTKKK